MSLFEYEQAVERKARKRDGSPIDNSSYGHAEILVGKLFEHAENKVDILSGVLEPSVFGTGRVYNELSEFLSTEANKIRIILQNPENMDKDKKSFFQKFKDHDGVEFRGLKRNIAKKLSFHFTLADEKNYRFEPDIESEGAIGAFGDIEGGEHLSKTFETLWEKSDPIES